MSSNNPTTLEAIQRDLNKLNGIGYGEDDVRALLKYTGIQMTSYIADIIGSKYRQKHTNIWHVPSSLFWDPLTLKAYDELLPIAEDWLKEMKKERDALKIEILKAYSD